MLSAIDPKDFLEVKQKHLELVSQFPLINSVLSRVQHGLVYADAARDWVFVCTKSGFSLVSARGDAAVDQKFLEFLLQNKEIPEYIHLYRAAGSFPGYLETNWPKYKLRRRAQFRNYHRDRTYDDKDLLPAGYRIAVMQELSFEQLDEAFGLNFGHRYWDTKEDFLNRGIGACIVTEHGEPVAICYSACVVDGIAEVDVVVLPEHRGKRFLRIVSGPFLNQAISRNLVSHWDAFIENSRSYMMPQKFDMTLIQEYDLLSVFLR
jgi:GNAT superfamily N-acetyltransferase